MRAAISTLQYHRDLPRLPGTFSVPDARNSDMLDLLQCVFGFQVSVYGVHLSFQSSSCACSRLIATVIILERNRLIL